METPLDKDPTAEQWDRMVDGAIRTNPRPETILPYVYCVVMGELPTESKATELQPTFEQKLREVLSQA